MEMLPSKKSSGDQRRRREHRLRRRALEGGGGSRTRALNKIYKRDEAICWWCKEYVAREDASREHLFRPLSAYPEFARDILYSVLAHKWCNK
jgi:hypothetical protein